MLLSLLRYHCSLGWIPPPSRGIVSKNWSAWSKTTLSFYVYIFVLFLLGIFQIFHFSLHFRQSLSTYIDSSKVHLSSVLTQIIFYEKIMFEKSKWISWAITKTNPIEDKIFWFKNIGVCYVNDNNNNNNNNNSTEQIFIKI